MTAYSFQLYTARNFQPYKVVIERLANMGYRHVEGFDGAYRYAADIRSALDRHAMTMPSGHFGLTELEDGFDGVLEQAKLLGIEMLVCPYLAPDDRPTDIDGWTQIAHRLEAAAKKCAGAGYPLAWHNHDFEFAALDDGRTVMKLLLNEAPSIGWEIDVAWVVRGDADPMPWIDEYGKRITAAHIKDIAAPGENADEDGWADIGTGNVDWATILPKLQSKTAARIFAVEHDNPSNLDRFARRSIDWLHAL